MTEMTGNTVLKQLMSGIPHYRILNILDQCFKHYAELPAKLRIEVDNLLDSKLRMAETQVKELELSTRARNVLENLDCKTVSDIIVLGRRKILTRRGCGEKTIREIQEVLHEMGFAFPEEESK